MGQEEGGLELVPQVFAGGLDGGDVFQAEEASLLRNFSLQSVALWGPGEQSHLWHLRTQLYWYSTCLNIRIAYNGSCGAGQTVEMS